MLLRSVRRLGALGLLAVAAGCTPTYLLGVHPARPHATLTTADDYAEAATADSVRMALRFMAYEPEWLVFEAEYHNDSQQPITIDPTAFAHVPSRQAAAPSAWGAASGYRLSWPLPRSTRLSLACPLCRCPPSTRPAKPRGCSSRPTPKLLKPAAPTGWAWRYSWYQ